MKLAEIHAALADDRCRQSFAQVAANLDESADWRYVTTPDFISTDYIVSDTGIVVSLPRYRSYEGHARSSVKHRKFLPSRILRPGTQPSGHQTINIVHQKKSFRTHVHRLVAWAFYGPQPVGLHVRHLDGNPANNVLGNLQYGLPWKNVTEATASAEFPAVGILVTASVERRIDAALNGEEDPIHALNEVKRLLDHSRKALRPLNP